MKSTLLILLIAVVSTGASAQTFGIKGGMNMSDMAFKGEYGYSNEDIKFVPGMNLSGTIEWSFSDYFAIETGVKLSTKGYKMKEEYEYSEDNYSSKSSYNNKMNLFYAGIPLVAKGSFKAGNAKIYGAFGPYLGFGIIGWESYNYSAESTYEGETESYSEKGRESFTFNDYDINGLDFGITSAIGIEFDHFLIEASFEHGISNVANYSYNDSKIRNRTFGLSIGYKFGEK